MRWRMIATLKALGSRWKAEQRQGFLFTCNSETTYQNPTPAQFDLVLALLLMGRYLTREDLILKALQRIVSQTSVSCFYVQCMGIGRQLLVNL